MADSIMVLTFKGIERLLTDGGTSSWRLSRKEALKCKYAICARNRFDERNEGMEEHGTAFLIGRIRDIVPANDRPYRWLIRFEEFAEVSIPDAWDGVRNPVRYINLADLGIDESDLDFKPMAQPTRAANPRQKQEVVETNELTIEMAKILLAKKFGVDPAAIEITIRA
ncbi:hypothetical protein [Sphingopyxis sp.]|uniref:hypothetical protein n=1 Tax=Sphingopyxis sp. TaxID=1908224 RepID=UPI002B46A44F|nr:hypothetical protein [Sphingopyxis sp.]HJS12213.1 hypothetical protein [Sphingopyxis sp.]